MLYHTGHWEGLDVSPDQGPKPLHYTAGFCAGGCVSRRPTGALYPIPVIFQPPLPFSHTGPEPLCLGLTITASLNKDK